MTKHIYKCKNTLNISFVFKLDKQKDFNETNAVVIYKKLIPPAKVLCQVTVFCFQSGLFLQSFPRHPINYHSTRMYVTRTYVNINTGTLSRSIPLRGCRTLPPSSTHAGHTHSHTHSTSLTHVHTLPHSRTLPHINVPQSEHSSTLTLPHSITHSTSLIHALCLTHSVTLPLTLTHSSSLTHAFYLTNTHSGSLTQALFLTSTCPSLSTVAQSEHSSSQRPHSTV